MSLVLDGLNEGVRAEQHIRLYWFTTNQQTCVRLTQIQPVVSLMFEAYLLETHVCFISVDFCSVQTRSCCATL